MDNVLDEEIPSSPRLSSRLRMPNTLRNQEAILVEKLHSLRQSRGGYVATMTKLCSKIDELLQDNSQLVGVRSLQTAFNDAFSSLIFETMWNYLRDYFPKTALSCRTFLVTMRHKKFGNGYMMKRLKDTPSTSPRLSIPNPLKRWLIRRFHFLLPRQDL